MSLNEYRPGTAFPGDRPDLRPLQPGLAAAASGPRWRAPNMLFVILDDTGFRQLGCYGSPIRIAPVRQ